MQEHSSTSGLAVLLHILLRALAALSDHMPLDFSDQRFRGLQAAG